MTTPKPSPNTARSLGRRRMSNQFDELTTILGREPKAKELDAYRDGRGVYFGDVKCVECGNVSESWFSLTCPAESPRADHSACGLIRGHAGDHVHFSKEGGEGHFDECYCESARHGKRCWINEEERGGWSVDRLAEKVREATSGHVCYPCRKAKEDAIKAEENRKKQAALKFVHEKISELGLKTGEHRYGASEVTLVDEGDNSGAWVAVRFFVPGLVIA